MTYPTDLTDEQWQFVEPFIMTEQHMGRPRKVDFRQIMNALLYKERTGCQWRMFPNDFPPSGTIRYYFDTWTADETLVRLHTALRERVRVQQGREPQPTAASIDSQTVKTTQAGGERGFDGGKKVLGRKRHILVDTEGNLLFVVVHPANVQDHVGAELVLEDSDRLFPTITKIWADQGYTGDLEELVREVCAIDFEIVKRDPHAKRCILLPRRWVVERTVAWLGRACALSKAYERTVECSETVIYLASIHLMVKRLQPDSMQRKPYALSAKAQERRQQQERSIG